MGLFQIFISENLRNGCWFQLYHRSFWVLCAVGYCGSASQRLLHQSGPGILAGHGKNQRPVIKTLAWKDFRQERSIKGEIQDFYDASTVKCLNVSQEIALGHQLTKRSCCMRQLGKNSAIHIQILHLPSSQKKHLLSL